MIPNLSDHTEKLWQTVASPVATILAWQLSDFNVVNGLIYKDIFEGVFDVNIFIVILKIVPKVQRLTGKRYIVCCKIKHDIH